MFTIYHDESFLCFREWFLNFRSVLFSGVRNFSGKMKKVKKKVDRDYLDALISHDDDKRNFS